MTSIKPYKDSELSKKIQIEQMFDNISSQYDVLNRILSGGIDITWRNTLIKKLILRNPKFILDLATGTADLAIGIAASHKTSQITGADLSAGMLAKGQDKINKKQLAHQISLKQADAEKLPFSDNTFDAITISFGVRNFEHLEKGLSEMYRVLKPGGWVYILEFSTPESPIFRGLYFFYIQYILPFIGKWISKDPDAYTYLPESVKVFPYGKRMVQIIEKCGFSQSKINSLSFGIASIYEATK